MYRNDIVTTADRVYKDYVTLCFCRRRRIVIIIRTIIIIIMSVSVAQMTCLGFWLYAARQIYIYINEPV